MKKRKEYLTKWTEGVFSLCHATHRTRSRVSGVVPRHATRRSEALSRLLDSSFHGMRCEAWQKGLFVVCCITVLESFGDLLKVFRWSHSGFLVGFGVLFQGVESHFWSYVGL